MSFSYFRVIRLQDTDAAGVIYFSHLFSICHEAYEDFLTASHVDFQNLLYHGSVALPIIYSSGYFFKPIYCGDRISVEVTVYQFKKSQFELHYKLHPELDSEQVLATAKTRHACIDKKTRKKVKFPDLIQTWLEKES